MLKLDRKKTREIYLYLFILPGILGFIFFWLIPIVYTFVLSLHKTNGLVNTFVGLQNFQKLFADSQYWKSLYNTLYMVVLGVPFNMAAALVLAMLLNTKIKTVGIFRTIFYIPTILPGVATAISMYYIFNLKYGLLNRVLGILGIGGVDWLSDPGIVKFSFILIGTWGVGQTMVIFLMGLQGIPETYYEAAFVDGANSLQQFRSITLPMLTPTILYNLILQAIAQIQIFTPAYVITNGGPDEATYFYVYKLYRDGFQYGKFGYASAEAVILFLVSLFLTYLVMKSSNSWVHYEGGK
jgi:multiple sugar transport system permease protein